MDQFEKLSQNSPLINQLGVTETEFKMYLQLLSIGPCTKTEFANKFKVPRTTVFANAERLIQKGLLTQITKNNRNIVVAENPKKLELLALRRKIELEEELNKAKESNKDLSYLIQNITDTIPNSSEENDMSVKYYIGAAGFRTVCQRILDEASKEILFISNMENWKKIYTEEDRKQDVPERMKRKIFLKALVVDNNDGAEFQKEDKNNFRETKILPSKYKFNPTFIISDQEISIISYSPSYLTTSIVMNDHDIAEFYKIVFAGLWEITSGEV